MEIDREKAKIKVQQMFDSKDESLWKIGRLICHELRIDYWVQTDIDFVRFAVNTRGYNKVTKVVKYSLEEIWGLDKELSRVYKIKLEKWKNY